MDRHPLEDNIDTYGKVAGHYGPNSNVYHLGLVSRCRMTPPQGKKIIDTIFVWLLQTVWTCITGTLPCLPSYANLVVNPLPRFDGAVWFTWGARILDDTKYGSIDREIRETVVACLGKLIFVLVSPNTFWCVYVRKIFKPLILPSYIAAEQPGQRISSQALLAWCMQKIEEIRHIPGSTDADLYAWATANMSSPPEPTAETAIPPFDPNDPSDKQVIGKLQLYPANSFLRVAKEELN